jgi:TnpA family transposase
MKKVKTLSVITCPKCGVISGVSGGIVSNKGIQWDDIVRVAASLKNNAHSAHLIIQRLANRASFDKLSKAILELGKLVTTIYIMRYISDLELRRVVQGRLSRCESRHNLAQHAFFFNQGRFKTSDYEQIMNKASCLSFLSNAILLWNTHHIQHITDHFRRGGIKYNDQDLSRISPLLFKHIIMHGTYNFNAYHHS